MTVHLRKVKRNLNPGGLWVRVCTVSGDNATDKVLVEGKLAADRPVEAIAEAHGTMAGAHVEATGEEVRCYVYDGDSGRCLKTMIVEGARRYEAY